MIKYRYFPFLGIKTFDDDDKRLYDIPLEYQAKCLVFEWGPFSMIILGKIYIQQENNGD